MSGILGQVGSKSGMIKGKEAGSHNISFMALNVNQSFAQNSHVKVDYSDLTTSIGGKTGWNNGGHYNTTNKRFVCPDSRPGIYWFGFNMMLTDGTGSNTHQYCRIRVNGSELYFFQGRPTKISHSNDNPAMAANGLIDLVGDDYVEVFLRHNHSGSISWAGGYGCFWGFKIAQ